MFDLGWTELLVIGVVALIVIGPKDLPVMFQQVGRFVGRAKAMAREFSYAMNQAADEAGVKDAKDSFKQATDGLNTIQNPAKAAMKSVKEATDSLTKLDLDPTSALSEDRADAARKIQEATAQKAQARQEAEGAAVDAAPAKGSAPKQAKDSE